MISDAQARQARKILEKYSIEQKEKAEQERAQELAHYEELVNTFSADYDLVSWAKDRWESDKKKGIGTGMTEERAISHYIEYLKWHFTTVCEAFKLEPKEFLND